MVTHLAFQAKDRETVDRFYSAALAAGGPDAVHFGSVVAKVVIPAVISPVLAGLVALAATCLAYWISTRADPARCG